MGLLYLHLDNNTYSNWVALTMVRLYKVIIGNPTNTKPILWEE